ncbi:hypothetical protein [Methanobrevibacter sp.]
MLWMITGLKIKHGARRSFGSKDNKKSKLLVTWKYSKQKEHAT